MNDFMRDEPGVPKIVDRNTFQAELDALRVQEKAHTREGDAIAAARRRLPMIEVDGATPLIGERGAVTLLDAFEVDVPDAHCLLLHVAHRPVLLRSEQVRGMHLGYIAGPRAVPIFILVTSRSPPSPRARTRRVPATVTSWGVAEMPWYSAQGSLDTLLVGRKVGMMHIVCYLRQGSNVFETYWTTRRGVEAMDNSYRLLDLTVFGRQETWRISAVRLATNGLKAIKLPAYRWTSHRPVVLQLA